MYEAMPPEQFKELFMAMLSYKGEDMDIKDPMVKALFAKEKVEIDRNEAEYERIRKIRQENGKKGGEAKKRANAVPEQVIPQEVVEVEPPKIITEQTEKISVEPRPLKECVDELMDIYHTKNYESMIYAINHKCRKWGYSFEELKAKCDTRIELGET